MKKKQIIRLTESDLHRVIKESVNRILKEDFDYSEYELDDKYTLDELAWRSAIDAFYTPSDGRVSLYTPENYDDGEKEIPFKIVPVLKVDYDDFKVVDIFADAQSSDPASIQEFEKYEDEINDHVKRNFNFYINRIEINMP